MSWRRGRRYHSPGSPLSFQRKNPKCDQAGVEKKTEYQHRLTWDRTDCGMCPQIVERTNRRRMNTNLHAVTDRLHAEHERIVAAQPASQSLPKTDMKPEGFIVPGQFVVPTAVSAHPFAAQNRCVQTCFQNADAR